MSEGENTRQEAGASHGDGHGEAGRETEQAVSRVRYGALRNMDNAPAAGPFLT
jgi:hypothetical protein